MRRAAEGLLGALALLAAVVFAGGAAGLVGGTPGARAGISPGRYFHGGKAIEGPAPDPACQGGTCHQGLPHRKSVAEAAFRNMHTALAECLSCHGRDPEGHWGPGDERARGRRVRYAAEAGGADPHGALGRPLSCRACHSDAGRATLQRRGIGGLPANFASPIALKMIEEKGKKWVTDEMR